MTMSLIDQSVMEMKYLNKLLVDGASRVYGVADEWQALKEEELYIRVTLSQEKYQSLKDKWKNRNQERFV